MPDAGGGEIYRESIDMIAFLKRYSTVDNAFIDDFFGLFATDSAGSDFLVDLDAAAKWLAVKKFNLMRVLKADYVAGRDYTVNKPATRLKGRGRNTRRDVMLTPDCFKALCMQSRSQQADRVRDYFIAVEKTLLRYRAEVVQAMEGRIKQLEASQRPLDAGTLTTGVIYVIRAAEGVTLHKIGRTKDLATRLRSHSSARADRLEVMFVFKTDVPDRVEACVKAVLKGQRYNKYKEVYEADLSVIKKAIEGCGELCTKVQRSTRRAGANVGGGTQEGSPKTFLALLRE